ncbi:hypothetical protein LCGC14_2798140, partial [marine sediment metagenome]
AAKELKECVGRNQPEKLYDVRNVVSDRLVRVKYTSVPGGSSDPSKELGSVRVDTIEIEDRE